MKTTRKKNAFLFTLLVTLFIASCDQKTIVEDFIDNDLARDVSVVRINAENTLRFNTKEAFESFVIDINSKNEKEKVLFCLRNDIETPFIKMHNADKELEEILNTSVNEEQFYIKYKIFKEKFSKDFYFNDSELDFSPYSKYINSELECIINSSGLYMIGDSIYKASSYENLDELLLRSISFTRSTISNEPNYAKAQTSSRRCEMWISNTGSNIYVRFLGKKKQWLGWFKNSMQFKADFTLTSNRNSSIPRSHYFEFYETSYFGYPDDIYKDMDNINFRIITKEYKDITVNFGRVVTISYPVIPILIGNMEIWSSELDYNDRGIASVDLQLIN